MKEVEKMKIEFKATLIFILALLKKGDIQMVIDTIEEILKE